MRWFLKFIYYEKATQICEIFSLLLTVCIVVKSKGKISQILGFSENMNFTGLRSRGPLKDLKDSTLILNESKLFFYDHPGSV